MKRCPTRDRRLQELMGLVVRHGFLPQRVSWIGFRSPVEAPVIYGDKGRVYVVSGPGVVLRGVSITGSGGAVEFGVEGRPVSRSSDPRIAFLNLLTDASLKAVLEGMLVVEPKDSRILEEALELATVLLEFRGLSMLPSLRVRPIPISMMTREEDRFFGCTGDSLFLSTGGEHVAVSVSSRLRRVLDRFSKFHRIHSKLRSVGESIAVACMRDLVLSRLVGGLE